MSQSVPTPPPRNEQERYALALVGIEGDDSSSWRARLRAEGFRVESFTDGAAALARLVGERVDLVLLAAELPDAHGLEVLGQLREHYSPLELPVMMVAAARSSESIVRAFDLGANDFIVRPLDFPVLLARIEVRLRGRRPVTAPRYPVAAQATLEPGHVLDGKYEIEELIGRGHYGMVFRARHLRLERPVAVKLLHPNYRNRADSLERFRREGISACQIEHPNAVSMLDYSVSEEGLPYLVMEYLEGRSLEAELRIGGPISALRTAVILLPICEVLAEAHSLGMVHRDIKPANVFLHQTRRNEVVKVLDFGIAKLVDDQVLGRDLSLDGSGPGTPIYMAPERFSKESYDGRADVYSLGVMLYEMLAGRPPFSTKSGNPIKLALMHMSQPPPALTSLNPELPKPLEKVVLQALAKDSAQRPHVSQLARRFVEALGMELPKRLDDLFARLAV